MRLRIGYQYDLVFERPTLVVAQLNVHPSALDRLEHPDVIRTTPALTVAQTRDGRGNIRARFLAPAGRVRIGADTVAVLEDDGRRPPGETPGETGQAGVEALPDETVEYLFASRFADFDRLLDVAWGQFGALPAGMARVEAICRFAGELAPAEAGATALSAHEAMAAGRGGARERTHVAIALCRALNIPARYCSGYLVEGRADSFDAWAEVYLGGRWHAVDAGGSHRGARLTIARGRDALDVEPLTIFGDGAVRTLRVWTSEIAAEMAVA